MSREVDILIAGGGLVGITCAVTLACRDELKDARICVVEKSPFNPDAITETFDPRVVAISEASRRLLLEAGIWNEALERRACSYRHMEVRDSEGTGFIEFDCKDVHQPNLGHIVENSAILAAANQRVAALPNIEFLYGSIDSVLTAHGEEGVSSVTVGGKELSAPLLVAADGANSLVREQCGFTLRCWDYGHTAIVATIKTAHPHSRTAYQWFYPSGPLAFLPLTAEDGDCHYSSIVWSQERSVAEELMSLADEDFCQRLSRASEKRLGDVNSISRRYSFPLIQRHATDYVAPGVVLVGDAAHTIHPLAGQGVNLGFADVAALGDEIVRALRRGLDVGHISTLKRYQRRRKPENLAMMAAMEGFKRLFAEETPLVRVLRNRGMSDLNRLSPIKNQLVYRAMGF